MSESENVKRTLNQAAGIAKECKVSDLMPQINKSTDTKTA